MKYTTNKGYIVESIEVKDNLKESGKVCVKVISSPDNKASNVVGNVYWYNLSALKEYKADLVSDVKPDNVVVLNLSDNDMKEIKLDEKGEAIVEPEKVEVNGQTNLL